MKIKLMHCLVLASMFFAWQDVCAEDIISRISYSNIDGIPHNYTPHYINGNIDSPPVSYYKINVVAFEIGRKKKWWKKYEPILVVNLENDPYKFNKIISTVEKDDTGSEIVKSKATTIRNEQITGWIPYNGNPFIVSVSLYPILVDDTLKSTLDTLSAIEKSLDPTKILKANLINRMDIFTNIASTINEMVGQLIRKANVQDEINYRVTFEQNVEAGQGNTKFQEGYYLITDANSGIKAENVKIDAYSNVKIAGLSREYSYMIIKIEHALVRKDLGTFAFYDHLRNAETALENRNLKEMDVQLNQFKIKLYDNDRFTLNEKKKLWRDKYYSFAYRAKKIDRQYEVNQVFFDEKDEIYKIAKELPPQDFMKKLEWVAISDSVNKFVSVETGAEKTGPDLLEVYRTLPTAKKTEFKKSLNEKFKVNTSEEMIEKYLKTETVYEKPNEKDVH